MPRACLTKDSEKVFIGELEVRGKSGVIHKFTLLCVNKDVERLGVDILQTATHR